MLEVKAGTKFGWSVMKAIGAVVAVFLAGALVLPSQASRAQSASSSVRVAQAAPTDAPPPPIRRTPRLRIYPNYEAVPEVDPRYYPGPNAVRECNATYVQEYRPSGTVIVPRMHCFWRPG
jgi:lipoprotein-anchoring transpeptidase ErfK/SrfK